MKKILLLFAASFGLWLGAEAQITITSPNGGETLTACATISVTYTKGVTASDSQRIDYSLNSGRTWLNVVKIVNTAGQTTPSIAVSVPNTPSAKVRFRVRDGANNTLLDASDASLTIGSIATAPIRVTAPNGGEVYNIFETRRISWTGPASNKYEVSYSTNAGANWVLIGKKVGNSLDWNIPISSIRTVIRVKDSATQCQADFSDTTFRVSNGPAIGLKVLNGGEQLTAGQDVLIEWSQAGVSGDFVNVEFSANNGSTWTSIENGVDKNSSSAWTVPAVNTTLGLIRVSDANNAALNDVSNSNFRITSPSIVLNNLAASITGCASLNLNFTAIGGSGIYSMLFSKNGGRNWDNLAEAVNLGVGSISYTINVPNTATTTGRFLIIDKFNDNVRDTSNGNTTIIGAAGASLTISRPNGGEILPLNNPIGAKWRTVGGTIPRTAYAFSDDNGYNWTELGASANADTTTFNILGNPSTQCLFRVLGEEETCRRDISDNVFTFSSTPIIEVISPNGGESFVGGQATTIRWVGINLGAGAASNVKIELSTDFGVNYTVIAASIANTGAFNYTFGTITTENARIRISKVAGGVSDEGDAPFSVITNNPPVVNAGSDLLITLPQTRVTFTARASDPDGNITSYRWTQISGPVTARLEAATTPTVTVSNLVAGTFVFRITVRDGFGLSASDDISVSVLPQLASDRWSWATRAGSTARDRGNKVVIDALGNSYIAGSYVGTVAFGSTTLTSASSTASDAFIAKYDSNGNALWARSAGGIGEDEAASLVLDDANGRIYITGVYNNTATFGSTNLTVVNRKDGFIAAMTTSGAWQWAKSFGGTGSDEGFDIVQGASSNLFVTGYCGAATRFGTLTVPNFGGFDIFLASYTTAGLPVWAKSFGGSGTDNGLGLATNVGLGFSGVAITGFFNGTINFGGASLTSAGGTDIFLAGLLETGTLVGVRREGGTGDDAGTAIEVGDPDAPLNPNYTYITGYFSNSMSIGTGFNITAVGDKDVFIAGYDPLGQAQMIYSFGNTGDDRANDIALTDAGIYLTGYYSTFFNVGNIQFGNRGGRDIFATKHGLDGTMKFAANAGSNSEDFGRGIDVSSNGTIYATGYYVNKAYFGDIILDRFNNGDFFLGKFAQQINANGRVAAYNPEDDKLTQIQNSIEVYPNPARGDDMLNLRVIGLADQESATIQLLDMTGKMVQLTTQIAGPEGLDISLKAQALKPGIYRIVCKGNSQTWSKNLTIK